MSHEWKSGVQNRKYVITDSYRVTRAGWLPSLVLFGGEGFNVSKAEPPGPLVKVGDLRNPFGRGGAGARGDQGFHLTSSERWSQCLMR